MPEFDTIDDLPEIRDTGISTSGFERLVKETGFEIVERRHFPGSPIYRYKFGLRSRVQLGFAGAIAWLRDFVTTTCYYLIRPSQPYPDERITKV